MGAYSLRHVSDAVLRRDLPSSISEENVAVAMGLARIAEFDARRLFVPDGFPSMHAYCMSELRMTEDVAYLRIKAARTARRFPAIFEAIADGRLNVSGVVLLRPYLIQENAAELLKAAELKTKAEIQLLLARRFPQTEVLPMVHSVPQPSGVPDDASAPEPVQEIAEGVRVFIHEQVPEPVATIARRPKVAPLSGQSFELHATIDRDSHEMMMYAQSLMGRVGSDQIPGVLKRAFKALVAELEKKKFGATTRPQRTPRTTSNQRHVPAHVRRAVWERDGGRCTFVSDSGRRCPCESSIEYDHIDPIARGGESTIENVRLRCRAHNQLAAERTFGAGFMDEKRREARRAAQAKERARAEAARAAAEQAAAQAQERAVAEEQSKDLICGLRNLGFRADQARRAAEATAEMTDATLEERIRAALKILCPKRSHEGRAGTAVAAAT
jgi:5-methylcytosine-specific restriction endonuclease McrA